MSFRNTFITDFIYQASDDTRDANPKLEAIFRDHAAVVDHIVDERGYGYYSGWLKTLDGSVIDMGLHELAYELSQATKVPFRLTVLVESGPMLTYDITPRI